MGLTKVSTDGVKDNAITKAKIPAAQIETSELASSAVTNVKIAAGNVGNTEIGNNQVSLNKLVQGTPSNDGKFLRANNGADPTFEDVPAGGISNLVEDTTPQLGGTLDTNGNQIHLGDGGPSNTDQNISLGNGKDLKIYHDGANSAIYDNGNGRLKLYTNGSGIDLQKDDGEYMISTTTDGPVKLYHNNDETLSVEDVRVDVKRRLKINNDAPNSGHGMALGQWDGSYHRIEGDANRAMFITSYNSSGIKFGSSGSTKASITSNGLLFNNDTAAANALDDYERGNWTPTLTRASGTIGGTLHTAMGMYIKVGKLVYITFHVYRTGASGGTSYYQLGGLPFGVDSSNQGSWSISPHMTRSYFDSEKAAGDGALSFKFLGSGNTYGYSYNADTDNWYTTDTNTIVVKGQMTYITAS